MEYEGFITDFGIEKSASAGIPRFGVWKWSDRHGRYEVVETSDDLRDLLFSYADFEIVPYYEEKSANLLIGDEVETPNGEGVITGIYGSNIRVIPSKIAGVGVFEEEVWDQTEVRKLAISPEMAPDAVGEGEPKNYIVTFPGYPSMDTKAKSKVLALQQVVQRMMEGSSNKKIYWSGEWYGEPQFGSFINKLKVNLEKYVMEASPETDLDEGTMAMPDPGAGGPPSPEGVMMQKGDEMAGDMAGVGGEGFEEDVAKETAHELAQEIIRELKEGF